MRQAWDGILLSSLRQADSLLGDDVVSFDAQFKGSGPTFGQMIRALRLGFYWLHEHGCFMRLSGDGPFRCELYPLCLIPNTAKGGHGTHKKFWRSFDGDDPGVDVNQIEAVRNIKRIKMPVSFYFDDNGRSL